MSLIKIIIIVILAVLALVFWQTYSQKGNSETNNGHFGQFIITHDDQNILFGYYKNDKHKIYLAKIDGTDIRKIKEGNRPINWNLSLDDKKLLLIQGNQWGKIVLIDLQSLSETSITTAGDKIVSAVFSSDGSKIYYTSVAEYENNGPFSSKSIVSVDLFSIDIDGTNQKKLTRLAGSVNLKASPEGQNLYLYRTGFDKFTVMKIALANPENAVTLNEFTMNKAYLIYPVTFTRDFDSIIYGVLGSNSNIALYERKLSQNEGNIKFIEQEYSWIADIKFMHSKNVIILGINSPPYFMEMNADGSNIHESPLSKLQSFVYESK